MGRVEYIPDDDSVVNLADFKQSNNQRKSHVNKRFAVKHQF